MVSGRFAQNIKECGIMTANDDLLHTYCPLKMTVICDPDQLLPWH